MEESDFLAQYSLRGFPEFVFLQVSLSPQARFMHRPNRWKKWSSALAFAVFISSGHAAGLSRPDGPLGLTWGMSKEGAKQTLLLNSGAQYKGFLPPGDDVFTGVPFQSWRPKVLLSFSGTGLFQVGMEFNLPKQDPRSLFLSIRKALATQYGPENAAHSAAQKGEQASWMVSANSGKKMLVSLSYFPTKKENRLFLIFAELGGATKFYGG